jgi:sugar lactone lactonase YvrE
MLNDVALGPDGIYITDTGVQISADGSITQPGPDRVFRITGRQPTTAVTFPGQPGPNGVTWDSAGSRLVVVPYFDSMIVTWAPGDSLPKPFASGPGMMDGIEALEGERFLVSAGADSSLNIIERDTVIRVAGGLPTPGDIGFDRASGRVAVPLIMDNRLELFDLSGHGQ